tara:strand:+ start:1965 stop:2270 length:306 start_codon:yes stop_codon:yes gene_type:complete
MTYKTKLPEVYRELLDCVVDTVRRSEFRNEIKFSYDRFCTYQNLSASALERGSLDDHEVFEENVKYYKNDLRNLVLKVIRHVHRHACKVAIDIWEIRSNGD